MAKAYDEIQEFLTSAPSLEEILVFDLSLETRERVRTLVNIQREGRLSDSELAELEEFQRVKTLVEELQVRARRRLGLIEED